MKSVLLKGVPVSVDTSPDEGSRLVGIGLIDGDLVVGHYPDDPSTSGRDELLQTAWTRRHKTPLRKARFGTQQDVIAITKGKSLVQYDLETGKKRRTKAQAHVHPPFALLPFLKDNFHALATGDEEGVVRIWDFRASEPLVVEFTEHEDYVADLGVTADGRQVISASADATICAYSISGKKVMVQSEAVSSELLSVCHVSTKEGAGDYFAVSSGDGHVQLFREGEYGNLLERMDTRHRGTVDTIRSIPERPNFLISSSNDDGAVKLLHLHPHRVLATLGHHEDGTEEISVSENGAWVLSVGHDSCLRFWDLQSALAQVPEEELKKGNRKTTAKRLRLSTAVSDPDFFGRLTTATLDLPAQSNIHE